MCRLILTIAAVVAIAQLSLQANDQDLKYTFRNLGPDDTQMPDIVEISESNVAKRNVAVTPLNNPNLAFANWNNYVTSIINVTITNFVDSEICLLNPSFCCRFEITWPMLVANVNTIRYFYRFGIFQGLSGNANIPPPTVCSVFRCATENLLDCDRIVANINTNVVFTRITITANITRQSQYLLEPNSFNANLLPFDAIATEWHPFQEPDHYGVRYVLNTAQTNLYSFGINGTGTGIVGGDDDGGAGALAVSMFIFLGIFLVNFIA